MVGAFRFGFRKCKFKGDGMRRGCDGADAANLKAPTIDSSHISSETESGCAADGHKSEAGFQLRRFTVQSRTLTSARCHVPGVTSSRKLACWDDWRYYSSSSKPSNARRHDILLMDSLLL